MQLRRFGHAPAYIGLTESCQDRHIDQLGLFPAQQALADKGVDFTTQSRRRLIGSRRDILQGLVQGRPALSSADSRFFSGQPGRQGGKGIVLTGRRRDDGRSRDRQGGFVLQFIAVQFLISPLDFGYGKLGRCPDSLGIGILPG